jgi:hypothetical protein
MTPSPFGAARPRVSLRPRTSLPPLPDVHPDDAHEDRQDHLEALYEAEQAEDRHLEHSGLNRMGPVASNVVAFPARDETARAA